MMEYAYSLNEEDWMDYDSILDSINCDCAEGIQVKVFKGEQHPMLHESLVNADRIVEDIQERAYDEGADFTEDYLDDITKEQKLELEKFIIDWLNKHAEPARFYYVRNITTEYITAKST